RRVPRLGDALDGLDQPLDALALHIVGNLTGHRRGLRSAPRREDEREGRVVADLLDGRDRQVELLIRLARKPDDQVRRQPEIGGRAPHLLGQAHVAFSAVRPPHRLEDPGRAGLERQVRVLADRVAFSHRLDHRAPEVLRVRTREADPLDSLDRVAGPQQLAEVRTDVGQQVAAVRVDVLAEQGDLADAVAREALDLGEDIARPPALLAPADGRDDAVRALRVAAHRDLHPRLEAALAMHRKAAGEATLVEAEASALDAETPGADPFPEVRDRAGPEGD